MFKNLRSALAAMIAPEAPKADQIKLASFQPQQVQAVTSHGRPVPPQSFKRTTNNEGITGELSLEVIRSLDSEVLRKSLMGKLVYSTVAQAWNQYRKVSSRKTPMQHEQEALAKVMNLAAEAIAASDSLGYVTNLDIESFAFLLTAGVPAQLNEKNAALLAQAYAAAGLSSDSKAMEAKREEKRRLVYENNIKHLDTFFSELAGWTHGAIDPDTGEYYGMQAVEVRCTLKGAAALAAVANCIEFVSTWTNEITAAAELTLIVSDQKMIERELSRSTRQTEAAPPEYVQRIDDSFAMN